MADAAIAAVPKPDLGQPIPVAASLPQVSPAVQSRGHLRRHPVGPRLRWPIRGRASVEIVDGLTDEYVANARKSLDPETAAEFERNSREMYDQMARIAITPHWVRYYDFGIVGNAVPGLPEIKEL